MVFGYHTGTVFTTCAWCLTSHFDPETVELLALRDGLQLAANWGITFSCVECDALRVIQGVNSFFLCS